MSIFNVCSILTKCERENNNNNNITTQQSSIQGLTGRIEFNEGKRSNFQIDLLKLKRERVEKVGYWSPDSGINITDTSAFYETNATNITLIVMTREVSGQLMDSSKYYACVTFNAFGPESVVERGLCRPQYINISVWLARAGVSVRSDKWDTM